MLLDECRHERVAGGHVERLGQRVDRCDDEDVPDLDAVRHGEDGEQRRRPHEEQVRPEEEAPAVDAVRHGAAQQGEEDAGHGLGGGENAQVQWGLGEAVHQIAQRDELHPGPGVADD